MFELIKLQIANWSLSKVGLKFALSLMFNCPVSLAMRWHVLERKDMKN